MGSSARCLRFIIHDSNKRSLLERQRCLADVPAAHPHVGYFYLRALPPLPSVAARETGATLRSLTDWATSSPTPVIV